ncbi:MAG: radical SAM protein [Polyangiaceae bacterium]
MKALVKVGYACNENCTFCHTADLRELNDAAERVDWKIDRAKRLGYSMVVLSGGEPTIRPELMRWAARVAGHGLDFGLVTNGLLLSYKNVTDELIERSRLRYVYMSLHGGEAKTHRSVVRADTFAQAMGAIENLAGRIPDLTVNCVVTRANVDRLRGLVDAMLPFRGLTLKFSMTQPKGGGAHAFDVLVPDVEHCAERVVDAIRYGREKSGGALALAHDGLPFCLLPGLEDLYDDLKTHDFAVMIEADEDDFVPVDDVAKTHPAECEGCSLRGACPGLFRGYAAERGASMLRPRKGEPRANSYNFVPERDFPRGRGDACPIAREGPSPYDRGRTLLLRLRDRMRLVRTRTRDFSDEELLALKNERGQVYLDLSKKLAPDDFERDLVQLAPDPDCAQCEHGPRCAGSWVPSRVNVFREADAALRARLGELRGRVLDLGCGDGRYVDAFAANAAAGLVEYVGVDPDRAMLATLAARYPFGRFVVSSAEEIADDCGPVDHVLSLGSWNHFTDPTRALERGRSARGRRHRAPRRGRAVRPRAQRARCTPR